MIEIDSFFEASAIRPIINASETYTNLGGSIVPKPVLEAMARVSDNFFDLDKVNKAVCKRIALLTRNEAACVTSGASGGILLSAFALAHTINQESTPFKSDNHDPLREIIILDGAYQQIIPYWQQILYCGAKLVSVPANKEAIYAAINSRTCGIFLFAGKLYEKDMPPFEDLIPYLVSLKIPVVVDAAAQLPPTSNFWYYTKYLGADLVLFSGGKHIRGPQSTGLILGKKKLVDEIRNVAFPNSSIGRSLKVSKEELIGQLVALDIFVNEDEEQRFDHQRQILSRIKNHLAHLPLDFRIENEGRLGTYQPLLWLTLPEQIYSIDAHSFCRQRDPSIDIGIIDNIKGYEHKIFINAYNLQEKDISQIIVALEELCRFYL